MTHAMNTTTYIEIGTKLQDKWASNGKIIYYGNVLYV